MADENILIGLLINWIADRKITSKSKRSEHADEIVYFAREVRENLRNNEYWKEMFYK